MQSNLVKQLMEGPKLLAKTGVCLIQAHLRQKCYCVIQDFGFHGRFLLERWSLRQV